MNLRARMIRSATAAVEPAPLGPLAYGLKVFFSGGFFPMLGH
jgi:hypothetical protein